MNTPRSPPVISPVWCDHNRVLKGIGTNAHPNEIRRVDGKREISLCRQRAPGLVPFKVFRVSDGSAEMLVISDDNRIPSKNARVRVRGEVNEFALIGGRSFGLHLREKSIKYM